MRSAAATLSQPTLGTEAAGSWWQVVTQGSIAALRGTNGHEVDVDLRLFSEPFVALLQKRGVRLVSRQWSRCRFALTDSAADAGRLLFETATEAGAQIRGFRPAQRSLEDIFMEAVE